MKVSIPPQPKRDIRRLSDGRYRAWLCLVRRVARYHGFTLDELRRDIRGGDIMRARHWVSIGGRVFRISQPAMGKYMRRDHTTIMSGVRRGCDLLQRDPEGRAVLFRMIKQSLKEAEGKAA